MNKGKKSNKLLPAKPVEFTKLPPPQLPPRLSKEVLERFKYHGKSTPSKQRKPGDSKPSYIQVSLRNITNILKIKKNFSKLSIKQIEELNKSIFNNGGKLKPKINMTTKGSSHKQVIVPMGSKNSKKFISSPGNHVANLNHTLKNIKSETIVDFIHVNYRDLIITSNKIASLLDISVINRYIKSCNNIDTNDIQDTYLSQSKSYLKILGIPYLIEDTNTSIDLGVIESIIRSTHIFDNIKITLKSQVVKVSPKLDMAIVWIDIWNVQSSSSAKMLIN